MIALAVLVLAAAVVVSSLATRALTDNELPRRRRRELEAKVSALEATVERVRDTAHEYRDIAPELADLILSDTRKEIAR